MSQYLTVRPRGRKIIDLTGKRLGRLAVLAVHPERRRYACGTALVLWLCRCDCGAECVVPGAYLRTGTTKSCGCLKREQRTHGHTAGGRQTSAYMRWRGMLARCFNPNHRWYPYYGGRGITVREPWLKFEDYYAETGEPPPGKSLDRIDNDGDYGPGNWKWSSPLEQTHNRRPPKRKRRRSTVEEIRAAALARAATPPAAGGAP